MERHGFPLLSDLVSVAFRIDGVEEQESWIRKVTLNLSKAKIGYALAINGPEDGK